MRREVGAVTVTAREGSPADTILAVAREENADLIALATRGHGGVARLMLGSVATEVLQRADRPLLLQRPVAQREVQPETAELATSHQPPASERLVREIMVQPPVVVRPDATLEEAARLMLSRRIGCLPVVDERDQLVGIITESDYVGKEQGIPFSAFAAPQVFGHWIGPAGLERVHAAARTQTVRDIMSRSVATAREDEPVAALVARMIELKLKRLPVVRDGRVVGVVARHDLLRLMAPEGPGGAGGAGS
jgi:CBS domain-containing protein